MLSTKLFFQHLFICLISLLGLAFLANRIQWNDFISLFYFVIVVLMYIFSGYISTESKARVISYFSVAIIGIVFWTYCYVLSSNSTNYKSSDQNAGIWFFYELFITSKSSLNMLPIFSDKYSLNLDLFSKLIFPCVFSIFQFIGGQLKLKRINDNAS